MGTTYSYIHETYDDTLTRLSAYTSMLDMEPLVNIIPEFAIMGFDPGKFNLVDYPSTRIGFLKDTPQPMESTTAGAAASATTVPAATGYGKYFGEGDLVAVYSSAGVKTQMMVVTAVSGDNLTVVRDHGGSGDVTIAATDTLKIITRGKKEASGFVTSAVTQPTEAFNYTQILDDAVSISGSEKMLGRRAINDSLQWQIDKLFFDGGNNGPGKLAIELLNIFYHGIAIERTGDTAATLGWAGGFDHFVSTNVTDASGAALTKAMLSLKIRQVAKAGNMTPLALMSPWQATVIQDMYESPRRDTMTNTVGGSAPLTKIITTDGDLYIAKSHWCPVDSVYFLNPSKASWLPARPFETEDLITNDDLEGKGIRGEYSFGITNEQSFGKIHGLAYSD